MRAHLWDSHTGTTHELPEEFFVDKSSSTFGLILVRDVMAAIGSKSNVTRCHEARIGSLLVYTFQIDWKITGTLMVDWTNEIRRPDAV